MTEKFFSVVILAMLEHRKLGWHHIGFKRANYSKAEIIFSPSRPMSVFVANFVYSPPLYIGDIIFEWSRISVNDLHPKLKFVV